MNSAYGVTNPQNDSDGIRRVGSVIELRPEKEQQYRELHAEVWPAVLAQLRASNIRNYSIFIAKLDGKKYLFSYFEYTGSDYDKDMQAMANDPATQRWWQETDPCQTRLPETPIGENWLSMERVFFSG